jgi:hypothetical protein
MTDGVYHPARYQRRRDERIPVRLTGRITLPDGAEMPCATIEVSAGGVAVETPERIPLGERVVCHVEQIGRVEAEIVGHHAAGATLAFVTDRASRGLVLRAVDWIERRLEGDVRDVRRHPRHVAPPHRLTLRLSDGAKAEARLLDVSISGAAVETDERPAIGSTVWIGPMRGRVVRHLADGFAVTFPGAGLGA